uniref:SWIM-type domain-containing protein n=1 Tax=Lactuca sativa TaxID=4236 RepID=A0A9R1WUV7_LACSA|nr:hypothetical protein LSAT_V11C900487530 [Lactuca sativa]
MNNQLGVRSNTIKNESIGLFRGKIVNLGKSVQIHIFESYGNYHTSVNIEFDEDDVNDERILGKVFDTPDDAYTFYNDYSFLHGFGIRRDDTIKNPKTNEPFWKIYVCNKEGFKRMDKDASSENEKNVVEMLEPDVKQSFEQQDRRMGNGLKTSQIKKAVNTMKTSNVADVTSKQCADVLFEHQKQHRGKELYGRIKHFQDKTLMDSDQYFVVELFDDRYPRNIFWADGRARNAYTKFRDVVVFDVTYMTNKFKMPFAPFTGVNHHGQSILFGVVLLENEKEETFEWLFEHFLKCMFGRYPKAIITDQYKAMGTAIKKCFQILDIAFVHEISGSMKLSTFNRMFPVIVIFKRHTDNGKKEEHRRIKRGLKDLSLVYHLQSLEVDDELDELFIQLGESDVDSVGVHLEGKLIESSPNSTSRDGRRTSGAAAAAVRGFPHSSADTSPQLPVERYRCRLPVERYRWYCMVCGMMRELTKLCAYDKAVDSRRAAEEDEDFKTMNSRPVLSLVHLIEAKSVQFYTRKMFDTFKKEWTEAINNLTHETITKTTEESTYKVGQLDVDTKYWRIVTFRSLNQVRVTCSCSMYETYGILCKHNLYVMKKKHVQELLSDYILSRWTFNARYKLGSVSIRLGEINNENGVSAYTLFCVRSNFTKLIEQARVSPSEIQKLNTVLISLLDEQANRKKSMSLENASQSSCMGVSQVDMMSQLSIRGPLGPTTTNGRLKLASRIKSSLEAPKKRTCSYC